MGYPSKRILLLVPLGGVDYSLDAHLIAGAVSDAFASTMGLGLAPDRLEHPRMKSTRALSFLAPLCLLLGLIAIATVLPGTATVPVFAEDAPEDEEDPDLGDKEVPFMIGFNARFLKTASLQSARAILVHETVHVATFGDDHGKKFWAQVRRLRKAGERITIFGETH